MYAIRSYYVRSQWNERHERVRLAVGDLDRGYAYDESGRLARIDERRRDPETRQREIEQIVRPAVA